MKVFSKHKMTLNAIRKVLDGLKAFEQQSWIAVSEGQTKDDVEEKNLFFLDEWFVEEEEITGVKNLVEEIERLISDYDAN